MNILIVKTSAIGDVIHTLPALAALRRTFPDGRIDWLVEEAAADIVSGHPALNRLLIARRKSWIRMWKAGDRGRAVREVRRFVRALREVRYDLLIDFQGLLKSSIWVLFARAERKVGFGRGMEHAEMSYLFLNERIPAVSMDLHAVERERRLLRALGVEPGEVDFQVPFSREDLERARGLVKDAGGDGGLVAINPMTTWPTKHWLPERFARLGDRLVESGRTVVFTGGVADRKGVGEIQLLMRRPAKNLAGMTSLKELAALFSLAQAVVTTDTGPMHLAAAVGTPVVALFGPTAPWRTGPWGANHRVIRLGLPCSPCFKKQCPHGRPDCMEEIDVDEVLAAVGEVCWRI